jgi:uncharacterized protein YggE
VTDHIQAGADRRRVLTVQGRAELSVEPDTAVLRFVVRGLDPSYDVAMDELNGRVASLRRDLKAAGIERTRLKTARFDVHARTRWVEHDEDEASSGSGRRSGRRSRDGEEVFVGYVAEHGLELRLPVGQDLLNRAFGAVATSASEPRVSVYFDVEDRDALRQRVLRAAVEDARRSARTMADAAGVALGEIVRIEYGVLEVRMTSASVMYEMDAAPSRAAPDIEPSALEAEDQVTVVWEISA